MMMNNCSHTELENKLKTNPFAYFRKFVYYEQNKNDVNLQVVFNKRFKQTFLNHEQVQAGVTMERLVNGPFDYRPISRNSIELFFKCKKFLEEFHDIFQIIHDETNWFYCAVHLFTNSNDDLLSLYNHDQSEIELHVVVRKIIEYNEWWRQYSVRFSHYNDFDSMCTFIDRLSTLQLVNVDVERVFLLYLLENPDDNIFQEKLNSLKQILNTTKIQYQQILLDATLVIPWFGTCLVHIIISYLP